MNWKKEIGKRVRKARTDKGWTLGKLSEETSHVLSPSRISNYEQGLRLLKAPDATILAKALGVTASHLQCLDIKPAKEGDDEMSPEATRLLKSWGALPENDRMDYLRRIETLALAYRDPVPDEQLKHLSAKNKTKQPVRTSRKPLKP
jgi:transcriptional regulator with XRE-family HTH domain